MRRSAVLLGFACASLASCGPAPSETTTVTTAEAIRVPHVAQAPVRPPARRRDVKFLAGSSPAAAASAAPGAVPNVAGSTPVGGQAPPSVQPQPQPQLPVQSLVPLGPPPVYVVAVVIGRHPAAQVDGDPRPFVFVGDRLAESKIAAITMRGVTLADGRFLPVGDPPLGGAVAPATLLAPPGYVPNVDPGYPASTPGSARPGGQPGQPTGARTLPPLARPPSGVSPGGIPASGPATNQPQPGPYVAQPTPAPLFGQPLPMNPPGGPVVNTPSPSIR